MDERLPQNGPEQHNESAELDKLEAEKHKEALREKIEKAAEKHKPADHEDISKLEKAVEQSADSVDDLKAELKNQHHDTTAEQKYDYSSSESISRATAQARNQLKPAEKAVSKIVHNPKVEVVSKAAGATIARPSGFMYGAIFSFIATLFFLIISKKYGYEYNAFVGIITFVGGYFFGLIVELFVRLGRTPKKLH